MAAPVKFTFPVDMTKVTPVCLVVLALLAAITRPLVAADPVAVSSTSSEDYASQKFGPGAPKPESYLFFQGKFFGGTTRDPNLEHAQFNDIVKVLAQNMVKQNYFPSKDPKAADLLIVVHWGTTTVYEDPNRELNLENKVTEIGKYNDAVAAAAVPSDNILANLAPDKSALNLQLAISDLESNSEQNSVATNAQLLGFRRDMNKEQNKSTASSSGMTDDEVAMRLLLSEERYFVILMAYDYHTMKKGSKPTLLWSTRFSIRSPGNTFTGSLPVMSKAAADYFGHALDGVKFQKPDVPNGKVDVGVPKVVGNGK